MTQYGFSPHLCRERVGQDLVVEVAITDCAIPGNAPQILKLHAIDPLGGVFITVTYGPNRVATAVTGAAMTYILSGLYRYTYLSATTDSVGVYSVDILTLGSRTQRSQFFGGAFELVA